MSDLLPVHRPFVGEEELDGVRAVFASGWLGSGARAREFEERLRLELGARHVLAVQSGTAALHLALGACELGRGAEVLVPSLTHVAPVQAILAVGARPVFCEVLEPTLTLDVEDARARVGPRTRALVPVHYGGYACAMDEILALSAEHGLAVVEDAAHAFGSSYHGRKIGTLGDATCFSFDPVKNITCGDGGAIATGRDEIAKRVALARSLGISRDSVERRAGSRPWLYEVSAPGLRYELNDLQAAIGLVQLDRLDAVRRRKQAIVRRYDDGLAGLEGIVLTAGDRDEALPFLYTIRVLGGRRDDLLARLRGVGIQASVHFVPNHLQPAFAEYGEPLPVSERLFREVVSLPLYFGLSDADVERVVGAVRSFVLRGR